MTREQISEAVKKMIAHCETLQERYEPVSARSCLTALDYNREEADAVIRALHEAGFTNCLDPLVPSTFYDGNKMVTEHPVRDVCYWGPDQLKSRLHCTSIDHWN